jgi:hypothetical protein
MDWNSVVSEMEYPHWLMVAGGVLLVGSIGSAFQKKLNRRKTAGSLPSRSDPVQCLNLSDGYLSAQRSIWTLAIRLRSTGAP